MRALQSLMYTISCLVAGFRIQAMAVRSLLILLVATLLVASSSVHGARSLLQSPASAPSLSPDTVSLISNGLAYVQSDPQGAANALSSSEGPRYPVLHCQTAWLYILEMQEVSCRDRACDFSSSDMNTGSEALLTSFNSSALPQFQSSCSFMLCVVSPRAE